MYCSSCGKEIPDGTRYCPGCGAEQQSAKNAENNVYTKPITAEYVRTMSFGEAIKSVFSKYCCFAGRARRAEYWYWILFSILAGTVIGVIGGLIFGSSESGTTAISSIFNLIVLLPSLGVAVRRLHDIGKSGWAFLINLIPLVGSIIFIVWVCKDGQPGDNQYGPNPKE